MMLHFHSSEMTKLHQQRAWFWIAAVAIVAAIILLMVPHADSGHSGDLTAILPLLFVGLISPLALFASIAHRELAQVPDAPQLPSTFQRPPPFRRG
jgi:fatty acid desaturase